MSGVNVDVTQLTHSCSWSPGSVIRDRDGGRAEHWGQMAPLLLHILCTCSGGTSRIISGKLNNEQVQLLIWSLLRYINKHVFRRHNTTDYFLPIILCMMKWGCKEEINGWHYPIFVLHLTTALTRIRLHTEHSLTASQGCSSKLDILWNERWYSEISESGRLSSNINFLYPTTVWSEDKGKEENCFPPAF